MQSPSSLRTQTILISQEFLKQLLEEKLHQFGFDYDEQIVKMDMLGVPKQIIVTVKSQKERGVKIITHNAA